MSDAGHLADTDVLIAGAGPTGLVLALWLSACGLRVRIVDKTAGPGTTSRALGVQARTLELYRQLDLADDIVRAGHVVPAFNFWTEGRRRGRIPFASALGRLTPYPFLLVYPQDEHERLLIAHLQARGIHVEREMELVAFTQSDTGVEAQLRQPGGDGQVCRAAYLAGCDGAHSTVRQGLGIGFPGGMYDRLFYVADIEAEGPPMDGEIHINLDTAADFLAIFPIAGTGRARLIGTILDDSSARQKVLTFDDISAGAVARLRIATRKVNWFSTYRVHHRVADRLRAGRVFLLGDAGHIHSPAGGQGMNTGIGDAINLAWKIAAVCRGHADAALLDTYQQERIGFARRLVATTDRMFTLATSENPFAQFWRTRVAPVLVPRLNRIPAVRRFTFRIVSQLALAYRDSALSAGRAGGIRGGDRLPWLADAPVVRAPDAWQIQIRGAASQDLARWCDTSRIALHVAPWTAAARAAGYRRNAAYLVRPDGYVALAWRDASTAQLDAYLAKMGLNTRPNASIC